MRVVLDPIPRPYPVSPVVPSPQPFAVTLADAGWQEVIDAIPARVPEPLDQGDRCLAGFEVTIRFSSGDVVAYGPCRRPDAIEPLRRLLQRMWARRSVAERLRSRDKP